MKKNTMLLSMLLALATWVSAQNYPTQSSNNDSSQTKVQGCVARGDNGYTLTDKAGTRYDLTGETAQLNDHVGHEVQITGKTMEASNTPSSAPGTPASTSNAPATGTTQPKLEVSAVKHIAETCNLKPESDKDNPPMSEKPPKR